MTPQELEKAVHAVYKTYKEEILREGDWFFNLDQITLNFYDYWGESPMTCTAYPAPDNMTDFSTMLATYTMKD